MEEKSILNALCTLLNTWEDRPWDFLPETEGKVPGGVITALSASRQIKRYIDGSYTGQFPFGVSLYTDGASPAGKLAVLGQFESLTDWLSAHLPPDENGKVFTKIRQTTLPAKASVWQDGTEEYRAAFVLEYHVSQ
ncbi:MAG: hypothetical protein IJ325_06895 [Clostridia bacterium]|nr:hypothetical protein [Clostridia bacterium]